MIHSSFLPPLPALHTLESKEVFFQIET
uniref:Uncharacterized protein n=1 Tax=Arundo donax TaxID=35708 RepID=A0A0A9F3E2_ARUDO